MPPPTQSKRAERWFLDCDDITCTSISKFTVTKKRYGGWFMIHESNRLPRRIASQRVPPTFAVILRKRYHRYNQAHVTKLLLFSPFPIVTWLLQFITTVSTTLFTPHIAVEVLFVSILYYVSTSVVQFSWHRWRQHSAFGSHFGFLRPERQVPLQLS